MLCLLVPFVFWGCSGDDGATGATGDTGATGPPGPGVVSNEACVVCHGQNNDFQIANVHEFNPITGVQNTLGTATVNITSVVFGAPAGDNVPVTINFTFQAFSAAGANITSGIDLRTTTPATVSGVLQPPSAADNLAFASFLLAKLTPGANGSGNEWSGFVVNPGTTGSSPFRTNRADGDDGAIFTRTPNTPSEGIDTYSYTFPTSAVRVSDGYVDNVVMRAGVQFSIGGPDLAGGSPSQILSTNPITKAVLDLFSPNLKLQNTSDRRPVANATLDVVNSIAGGTGTAPTAAYPTKNDVTTAACNNCHDILAIHGGGRRETQLCVICHNPKLETAGTGYERYQKSSLLNMGHRIHTSQDNLFVEDDGGDWDDAAEFKYPQSPKNCLTCHKGTDPFWKTRPTRYACGSCHTGVNFATGVGHGPNNIGGARPDDSVCALCHLPSDILKYHAAKDGAPPTPNNPYVMPGLAVFQYGIDNVTVDNTNAVTIKFWIKKGVGLDNGDLGPMTYVNLLAGSTDNTAKRPSGFSGSPSFLIAHSGAAANPQDYTNWDESQSAGFGNPYATGQPKSVTIVGLPVTSTDNQVFTTKLTGSNSFPAGAKMRAVAIQSYFTQTSVAGIDEDDDGAPDNVGRHTPAVYRKVNGDSERRIVAKSGYVDSKGTLVDDPSKVATLKPVGCLECHEAFEGHGGSRVNNLQICVMCHNPQLTTSGRTIPDNVTIEPTIVSKLGSDPLKYPEVTQNMPSLIHGLHAGFGNDPSATSTTAAGLRQQNVRVNNYQIVRNRQETEGVYGVYIDSAEVTYPGDLTHCTKCHFPANPGSGRVSQSYKADLPLGVLFNTDKVTTGNSAETLSQIIAARQAFQGHDPSGNPTDLVTSPLTSRCGYCHDGPSEVGHFLSTGGADVKNTRSTAELTPATLAPVFVVLGP
jgi:OmcA/MtrC family decaheme c-type cytochrome